MFRGAVNVYSVTIPPDLSFQSLTPLPVALMQRLTALAPGTGTTGRDRDHREV